MNELVGEIVGFIAGMVVFAIVWFLFTYFPAKKRAGLFERPRVKYRVLANSIKTAVLFGVFYIIVTVLINVFMEWL